MRSDDILTEVTASHEITLQSHAWKNPRDVAGWLRRKGFQLKGSGKFGAVFAKPGYDRLVKISRRDDECWLRFAHWTLGMESNPTVPYIDWVHTYKDKSGTEFFIAVIERLAPFNRTAVMNTRDLPGLAYMYCYINWFDPIKDPDVSIDWFEDRFWKEGIIDDNHLDKKGYTNPKKCKKAVAEWLKNIKGGRLFINTLISAEKKAVGKCSYDMHSGNLMYRPSDQHLVVIDPLADLSELGASYQM